MVRFHALGAIDLHVGNGSDARLILSRQKRLGLLAYLVLARPGPFHRRDELVALFWPDLDQRHARGALRQALHWIRKTAGHDALMARGEEAVAIDRRRVWCDAVEMEERLDAGDHEGGLALYRGPLLPGLHLGGSADLDRWLEETRERLARRALTSASALSGRYEREGDVTMALEWARRAAALAPYEESSARTLIRLLDRAGETAGAIDAFEVFAERLRRELELDVADETRALVSAIRRRCVAPAPSKRSAATDVIARAEPPAMEPSRSPHPGRRSERRWTRSRRAAVASAFVAFAVFAYVLARDAISRDDHGTSHRVAVLPFEVDGSADLAWMREGLADLLSARLNGAGDLRTVDTRTLLASIVQAKEDVTPDLGREMARRFDAGLFVLGRVLESGGQLRARATLYDARGTARGTVEAHGAEERQLFALVDRLAQDILMLPPLRPSERLTRLGAMTTDSFPALKAWLIGEHLLRAGVHDSAVAAYERATTIDSSFALAWYRMSVARHRDPATTGAVDAYERALAHASRLMPRDQLLLGAFDAFQRHQDIEAERLYREVLSRHPDDVEAWTFLGEVITYYGLWRGRPIADARLAFERVLTLDPTSAVALDHLSWIAAMEERFDDVARLTERLLALQPRARDAASWRLRLALARRDARAEREALAALRATHWNYINWAQRDAHFSGNLEGRFRAAQLLTEIPRSDASRRLGHTVMARYLLDRGRWRDARAQLDSVRRVMPDAWHITWARHHLAPLAPVSAIELEAVGRTLASWTPTSRSQQLARLYYLGVVSARRGDSTAAESVATQLDARSRALGSSLVARREASMARDLAIGVRAWIAWERGRAEEALRHLDQLRPEAWRLRGESGGLGVDGMQVWLRAEVLARLGRDTEALQLYAPLGFMWGDAGMLAAKHLRMAEIHDRRGARAEAVRHYERFIEIWQDCDAEARDSIRRAEQRLTALRSGR